MMFTTSFHCEECKAWNFVKTNMWEAGSGLLESRRSVDGVTIYEGELGKPHELNCSSCGYNNGVMFFHYRISRLEGHDAYGYPTIESLRDFAKANGLDWNEGREPSLEGLRQFAKDFGIPWGELISDLEVELSNKRGAMEALRKIQDKARENDECNSKKTDT